MALFPECVKLRVVVSWVDVERGGITSGCVEMSVRQLSSRCVGLSVYNTVVLPPVEDASKELAERCAAMNVPLPHVKRRHP